MDETKKFWLCSNLVGIGPVRLKKLLESFGSLEKAFSSSYSELLNADIPKNIAIKMKEWESLPWEKEMDFCKHSGISIVTLQDKEYPALLKQVFDPPILLYVKGILPVKGSIMFAIVGTRNPSTYGLRMAEKFAEELSYYGIVIVSGMARGIDTAAHKGALKAGGTTVAVIGSGFKYCYPRENTSLAKDIAKTGAVITEFPSDIPPEPQNFPRRNRIVSGLSRGVLVTAHLAADQGREAFALPGRVDTLSSKGTNQLLKEGASLAESTEEVIDGLNLEIKKPEKKPEIQQVSLSGEERSVLACIKEKGTPNIDQLLADTGIERNKLFQALLALIVKNLITELPGKSYTIKV